MARARGRRGKVSIVGAGMRSHPGVAAKVFSVLADEGINIEMISTSPIKISCVIDGGRVPSAVKALHSAFEPRGRGHDRRRGAVPPRELAGAARVWSQPSRSSRREQRTRQLPSVTIPTAALLGVSELFQGRKGHAHRQETTSLHRSRWISIGRPVLRYSQPRDAYVLRVVGRKWGPVLRLRPPPRARGYDGGTERRGSHAPRSPSARPASAAAPRARARRAARWRRPSAASRRCGRTR